MKRQLASRDESSEPMIRVYRPTPTDVGRRVHGALCSGLDNLGIPYMEADVLDYRDPVGLAVVQGWIKKILERTRFDRGPVIRGQLSAAKPILCVERGYVGDRSQYSALCWNGFNGMADWSRLQGMPDDRWRKLGIQLEPWRRVGDHVLVCAQVPRDANVADHDHVQWLSDAMQRLRSLTGRPIVFRAHPKARTRGEIYDWVCLPKETRRSGPQRTLIQDLENCHALVCWNSNSATEAVISGIPAIVMHPNCQAWDVTSHELEEIEQPRMPDRDQWAFDLAYRQWSVDEISSGEAWVRVLMGTEFEVPGMPDDQAVPRS